jgi:hypothetical protein
LTFSKTTERIPFATIKEFLVVLILDEGIAGMWQPREWDAAARR